MENTTPDFDDVAQAVNDARAEVGAAELHGALCGFLCAGGDRFEGFALAMSLDHLLDAQTPESARAVVGELFQSTRAQLDDDAFGFPLLLPPADTPISERGEALVQWCQGFVSGLGLGGFTDERKLSPDGREVLRDIAEIARTRLAFDEAEDVDEEALAELSEFVRVGVLLLREDLRAGQRRKDLQ
jgi:uncharacterized protein YgfB (UPF0149 family)